MGFKQFCSEVINEIGDYLLKYDIENIKVETIKKNNGVPENKLLIRQTGNNIAPSITLEPYYSQYEGGKSMESILAEIAQVYGEACEQFSQQDVAALYEPDTYYDNVYLRLVNMEKNRDVIRDMPYRKYMDLAVTMRVMVKQDEGGIASMPLGYQDIARLELNQQRLWNSAMENTRRMFPAVTMKLEDTIRNVMPDMEDAEIPETGVYVLTNSKMINGATAMLYAEEEMAALAQENDCSYFIIPSSIHEVLLCPDDGRFDAEELQAMVQLVNDTQVQETERLSDSIYRYDKDSQKISMEFEKDRELEAQEPERNDDMM